MSHTADPTTKPPGRSASIYKEAPGPTFWMDRNALHNLVEKYNSLKSANHTLNEADTKNFLINPLLVALGWDFNPNDIQSEFPVKMGSGSRHYADYALKVDGGPYVFLEAKSFGTPLDIGQLKQAVSYGRLEFVRWCLITNGEELILLDSQLKEPDPEQAVLFRIPFADLTDYIDYLEALTPEGLKNRALEDLTQEITSKISVLKEFQNLRPEYHSKIASVIEDIPLNPDVKYRATDNFLSRLRSLIESGGRSPDSSADEPPKGYRENSPGTTLPEISRSEISGDPAELVAIFPSRPYGVNFLKRFNAWGFVSIRTIPNYCAMYIAAPEKKVLYFAKVQAILPLDKWLKSGLTAEEAKEYSTRDPNKNVVVFSEGSLRQLTDPIHWTKGDPPVQGLRFTTLESFKAANRVGNLNSDFSLSDYRRLK